MVSSLYNATMLLSLNDSAPITSNSSVNHTAHFNPYYDTFLILLALLIIAINGLVICLFMWKPFLKEITNYFLVSLAVSDGLTGLLVIPIYFSCSLSSYRVQVCFSFDMIHRMTAFSTVYHLLLITCDRYVAITRPFRHSSTFTARVAYISIVCVWSVSMFLPLVQLTWYDTSNLRLANSRIRQYELRYNITCAVVAFLLPVTIMIIAYAEMLRIVVRHARAIEATSRERQALSKEKRAMAIFATMLFAYVFCWFSFFFMSLASDLPGVLRVPEVVAYILFFFRFCTSIINPIIYIFCKTDFKRALREVVVQYQCRAIVSGFLLQNYSVSNNDDDDSSPRGTQRTHTSRAR